MQNMNEKDRILMGGIEKNYPHISLHAYSFRNCWRKFSLKIHKKNKRMIEKIWIIKISHFNTQHLILKIYILKKTTTWLDEYQQNSIS